MKLGQAVETEKDRAAFVRKYRAEMADPEKNIMHIRAATDSDRDDIHSVHWAAFPEDERDLVSSLAINLLSEETTPRTISLVAEIDGTVVGHVAFSPVTIDGSKNCQGYILAPLGVKPDYQKRGIGSKLIEAGLQLLRETGTDIILVYGDPAYYGRFGFSADAAERFTPPYKLQYPFGWQAIVSGEHADEKKRAAIGCVTSLNDSTLW